MTRLLIGLVVLACGGANAAEESRVATEDSWISGLNSSSPRGNAADLGICPAADYWIYLKFDLTGLPGAVRDAELRMTRYDGSRPREISAYAFAGDAWSEATLAGANRPEPRNPSPDDGLATGAETGTYDVWRSPALTAAVTAEAAGDGTLTLMVREDPNGVLDVRHYYSTESGRPTGELPTLVLTLDDETVDTGWETVTIAEDAIKPALAYGPDGRLHVMWMLESTSDGGVWHASSDSFHGPWTPTTVDTGYYYGPGDLVVDTAGNAHMGWHNHPNQNAEAAIVSPTGAVETFDILSPSHNGWDNALALGEGGRVYMSSTDPISFGATDSLEYSRYDGNTWTYLGAVPNSGAVMYALATSVAVDGDGYLHIAYATGTGFGSASDIMYAWQDSGGWNLRAVATGGINVFPTLALDHWERPHVAWLSAQSGPGDYTADIRYAVLNSDVWESETVGGLSHVELSSPEARKSVALHLDENWRPHVAYADKRAVGYATKPFADWEITTVLSSDADRYKGLVEMDLHPMTEQPAIAIWERDATTRGKVRVLRPLPAAGASTFQLY